MERKKDTRKEIKGSVATSVIITVFLVGMAVGMVVFIALSSAQLWGDISAYLNYRQTTGTVLSKRIVAVKGEGNDTFKPEIRYSYEVDGKKYESTRYRATETSLIAASRSVEVLARYEVGSRCTVYYDPKDPSKAVLTDAVSAFPFAMLCFALGFLLVFCAVATVKRDNSMIDETLAKLSKNPQAAAEQLHPNLSSKVSDYGNSLKFVARPRRLTIILAGLSIGCYSQIFWPLLISENFSFVSFWAFPLFLFLVHFFTMFYKVFVADSERKILLVEKHTLTFVEPEEIEFENIDRIAPEGYGQRYTKGAKNYRMVRLIIFLKDERKLKVVSTHSEYGRKLMALLIVRLRFLVTGQAVDAAQVLAEVNSAAEVG